MAWSRAEVDDRIRADIQAYSQHVICVGITKDDPDDALPFTYTIGNHERGLPEILLIGWCDDIAVRIVNILSRMQRDRKKGFQEGELVDYGAKCLARMIDGGSKGCAEYAFGVGTYYRVKAFEIRQVLLPDHEGRYPGEPGCLSPYSLQPLLSALY